MGEYEDLCAAIAMIDATILKLNDIDLVVADDAGLALIPHRDRLNKERVAFLQSAKVGKAHIEDGEDQ